MLLNQQWGCQKHPLQLKRVSKSKDKILNQEPVVRTVKIRENIAEDCVSTITSIKYTEQSVEQKGNSVTRTREKYEKILRKCVQRSIKYTDKEFPAEKTSLFKIQNGENAKSHNGNQFQKGVHTITRWQRPEDIRFAGSEKDWVLANDPRPADICQGELGNCWFVAALALIAERKELLSKIFVSTEVNTAGVYIIRLFKDGNWVDVIVDDLLPCDSFHRLVFSSCRRKQLWVPLIEKAMAKLHGSYESLQSGSIWDGLNYLTGFVSERILLVTCLLCPFVVIISRKTETDRELLWGRLLSFCSSGFLMGATITSSNIADSLYEKKGLVTNHVYSILQVAATDGNRLIQLSNPWGRFSWKGDWADDSSLWTAAMRQELSPNQSQQGIFWMSYQHFMKYFSCLDVCKVRQGWKTYSMDGILPPYADQTCQPCFELNCKTSCEIDISLYQNSRRNSRETVSLTDIGFLVYKLDENAMKFIQPMEMAMSTRKRCVTSSILLSHGRYCILPFSFGHWTTEESNEKFYTFTMTIHSSRELFFGTVVIPSLPYLLADALIFAANKFGKRKRFSDEVSYRDISLVSVNLGVGHYTVVENRSSSHVHLEMDSSKSENYTSTRGSFVTRDYIPPYHCQVVQLLTAIDTRKSSKISNSYQLHAHENDRHNKLDDKELLHSPKLDSRISGLHRPRSITID